MVLFCFFVFCSILEQYIVQFSNIAQVDGGDSGNIFNVNVKGKNHTKDFYSMKARSLHSRGSNRLENLYFIGFRAFILFKIFQLRL